MAYEAQGTLTKIFPTEQKTSTFQAREFVIEIPDGNYPQYVKFQVVQDRCSMLDSFKEGENVKVHFDLRGREWQGKYFTSLNAWRVETGDGTTATATPPTMEDTGFPMDERTSSRPAITETESAPMPSDDLPF